MDVDVTILGAGVAAGAAVGPLRQAGLRLTVLEKSRGVGGRAATRRIDGIPVDHGAQFFTARSQEFAEVIRRWKSAGVCAEWCTGFHQYQNGRLAEPPESDLHARYMCPEGMTALAKECFQPGEVRREHLVHSITREGGRFLSVCTNGEIIRSRAVLSTLPLTQGQKLLAPFFDEPNRFALDTVRVDPCLAAIVELRGPSPAWKGIQVREDDALTWLGADFSKRTPAPPRRFVVLHATAGFSHTHLEGDHSVAGRLMLDRARQICPSLEEASVLQVHRWRYAKASHTMEEVSFWRLLATIPLFLAGDAFGRGNLESAWLSGAAAGRELARELYSDSAA